MYERAIIITGPTTSGKTAVACAFAERVGNAALVNMDRAFLIRGFPLCTGYSDIERECKVPTRLYQLLSPSEDTLSIPAYVSMADGTVSSLLEQGMLSVIEGGSMDYLGGLLQESRTPEAYWPIIGLKLPSYIDLRVRMEKRLDKAIQVGLIDEVKQGLSKGLCGSYLMDHTIVVPSIVQYLTGKMNLEEVKEDILEKALKFVAKWTKEASAVPQIDWIEHDPEHLEETVEQIFELFKSRRDISRIAQIR